jgi:magnesium transporter
VTVNLGGVESALERLIREGSDEDIRRFFNLLRPPELADLLEHTAEEDRLRVLRLMGVPLASDVMRELEEPEKEELLEDLSPAEIADIAAASKSDDAADLIASLPPEKAEDTLERLEGEERREIERLLRYPEESAGGIMQTEVLKVPSDTPVEAAIEAVRDADPERIGEIHQVYVVDKQGRLVGSVSPADLLQADPALRVKEIVDPNPISVPVTMDQEQIAEKVVENDLAAVPVVDEKGVLLGQVLHDDVADVIEEEATEDIAKLAGADPEEFYDESIFRAVRNRAGWLLPAFLGGLLVTFVLGGAEDVLRRVPWLASFLPVILGMAGNVGTQTSALTVRGLALGRIRVGPAIRRQALTGLFLGIIFGILLFGFTLFRESGTEAARAGLTVAFSIFTSMTVAALMGVCVPLLVNHFGFDPAVASSPFVQTANDLTGAGIAILATTWILLT